MRHWRFYDLPYGRERGALSEGSAVAAVRETVEQAVGRQMVADVPVGAFLSGGLDSSAPAPAPVNAIDRDGVMEGYDLELIAQVREAISLPMTALGGAGTVKDMATLIESFGIIGAAAGSLFVFKGKYRAVLINYPGRADKDALVRDACLPA